MSDCDPHTEIQSPVDDVEFHFCQDGESYRIEAFAESGEFTASEAKGLHDIYRLVARPDVRVPMMELEFGVGAETLPGDARSRQPVADTQTIDDLCSKEKGLRCDIAAAESDLEREELEKQLEAVRDTGRKLLNKKGKPRNLNDPHEKLRSRIKRSIRLWSGQ